MGYICHITDAGAEGAIIAAIREEREIDIAGISSSVVRRIAGKLSAVSLRDGGKERGAGAVFGNGMRLDSWTGHMTVRKGGSA